jgi:hypothetical protein
LRGVLIGFQARADVSRADCKARERKGDEGEFEYDQRDWEDGAS